jgi:2-methylisocitrate lyase-like PEP mutase family enzyme
MNRDRQRELAAAFGWRHHAERIIVLPNAFDCASARLIARHAPAAIGTSSAALAWAAGYPDGQRMPREEMLAAVERIVEAVDVGVTVDIEAGYGDAPEDAADTAARLLELGAIGLNLEDARHDGPHGGELLDASPAADKIAAVREVARREGVDLVVNARTDVFLAMQDLTDAQRVIEATARGNAYLGAGADCVFVPGATGRDAIEALVTGVRGPVGVYALPGLPNPAELERLGVRRVSVGCGPYQACLALLEDGIRALLGHGSYAVFLTRQLSYPDMQELLGTP